MKNMITEVFNLQDDCEYVDNILYNLEQDLINYKEIDEAYENLGLKRTDI